MSLACVLLELQNNDSEIRLRILQYLNMHNLDRWTVGRDNTYTGEINHARGHFWDTDMQQTSYLGMFRFGEMT